MNAELAVSWAVSVFALGGCAVLVRLLWQQDDALARARTQCNALQRKHDALDAELDQVYDWIHDDGDINEEDDEDPFWDEPDMEEV